MKIHHLSALACFGVAVLFYLLTFLFSFAKPVAIVFAVLGLIFEVVSYFKLARENRRG